MVSHVFILVVCFGFSNYYFGEGLDLFFLIIFFPAQIFVFIKKRFNLSTLARGIFPKSKIRVWVECLKTREGVCLRV